MNELFSLYGGVVLRDNRGRHYDVKYVDVIEMCNPNDIYFAISPSATKYNITPRTRNCSNSNKRLDYIVNLIDGTVLGYVETSNGGVRGYPPNSSGGVGVPPTNGTAYVSRGVLPFLKLYIPDDDIIIQKSQVGAIWFDFKPKTKFGVDKHIKYPLLTFHSEEKQIYVHRDAMWLSNVKAPGNIIGVGIGDIMLMTQQLWHYVLYKDVKIVNDDVKRLINMFNNAKPITTSNVKPHPSVKRIVIKHGEITADVKVTIEVLRAYADKLYYIKLTKPLTLDLRLKSSLSDINTWEVIGNTYDHANIINQQICLGNVTPSIDTLDDVIRTINDIVTLIQYPNLDNSVYGGVFLRTLIKEGYISSLPKEVAHRYGVEQ